ncbi:MAG: DUF3185 family protein [Deltaproteobacteria bacterium]|nr:DUF3185 family protein [Deltaproteobacteria bacterium]
MNNQIIGAVLTAVGAVLGYKAYDEYHSAGSSLGRAFGSGSGNSVYYFAAGALVCVILGLGVLSGKVRLGR